MQYMTCNTCRRVVQLNATGICLGCQRGFVKEPQEDSIPDVASEVTDEKRIKKNDGISPNSFPHRKKK